MSGTSSFGATDYCVFIGMLLVSTGIGIFYAWKDRKRQSNKEFLMGGKQMGLIPVSMSLVASFMSSITILGYPTEIYTKGTQFWVSLVSCVLCTIVAAEVFLPIFYKINLTSVNEYLYKRYQSNAVRVVASFSYLIASLPYLGIVLYGPSLALGAVTKLSVFWSVILMGVICTFYTTIGGLKAVIWTDVVQFVLMVSGLLAVAIKGTIDVGGVSEAFHKASLGNRIQFSNTNFDIYSSNTLWSVLIGTGIMWTGGFSTNQMQVQRSCSMSNIRKAKASLYLSMPGFMLLLSLACYCGVVVYATYYQCDPIVTKQIEKNDQLMPFFVLQSFSDKYPGIPGLFVACVFSSSLSTLSSGYNAIAAIVWEDFFKQFFYRKDSSGKKTDTNSKKYEVWTTKLIAALIGLVSIAVAFIVSRVGTIFEAAMALSGAQLGPMFALFAIGVFFPYGNSIGAIVGLLSGQISCLFITIGAIIHRRPSGILPTSVDGCDLSLFPNTTALLTHNTLPLELLSNATIPTYYPVGLNAIYHISPYMVPFFGFIISSSVGVIVSILTGGMNGKCIDPELMNTRVSKLYSLCTPKKWKQHSYCTSSNSGENNHKRSEYAMNDRKPHQLSLTMITAGNLKLKTTDRVSS